MLHLRRLKERIDGSRIAQLLEPKRHILMASMHGAHIAPPA